jgi:hypothetical protein
MQSLTEVLPHPVTTTSVPTATALLFKAMDLTVVLPVKAGLT